MAIHIDADGLHHDQATTFALACPRCEVFSHLTPVSVPDFRQLAAARPSHVGIVYRCDSCAAPVFLRYAVKIHGSQRVELASGFHELERPPEKFGFDYLPEQAEFPFREALGCFQAGCWNAFASMCRRTAQAVFADLGENGKLRMFDQLAEVRDLADLDQDAFNLVRKVLFGTDAEPGGSWPVLDAQSAGVLLEVTKDLLHQAYVRPGRLQQALAVRRWSAGEADDTITSIVAARGAPTGSASRLAK